MPLPASDDLILTDLAPVVADLFTVDASYRTERGLSLSLGYRFAPIRSTKLLSDRLTALGYRYEIRSGRDGLTLTVMARSPFALPPLNLLLFVFTLLNVYLFPVFMNNLAPTTARWQMLFYGVSSAREELTAFAVVAYQTWVSTLQAIGNGVGTEFTIAVMSILLVHEMGHFVAGRRRKIATSWPYFIPAPSIIGTFGAFIRSLSAFWNRRDLIEVGAAGPIAGWIVAVGWLIWGLAHSEMVPVSEASAAGTYFVLEGESLLMRFLTIGLVGAEHTGYVYKLSEAAFAGWVGLLVTSINMLPIGQLDGGHITYGLFRRWQYPLGLTAMGGLFILGFQSPNWWVFGALGLFMGVAHPPTLDDDRPISKTARWMGIVSLVIFAISFAPIVFPWPAQ